MFRRRRKHAEPQKAVLATTTSDGNDVFLGLRYQLISGDPASFGIAPTARFPRVWGVLFEQGMGRAIASVVSQSDGSTSLYTSAGGGVLGGAQRPSVADSTLHFLDVVEANLDLTTRAEVLPLPEPEEVRFNVLTYDGFRTASARRADLGDHAHPLRPVFVAGHAVITQLRLVSEANGPGRTQG